MSQVERSRTLGFDQIGDPPVRAFGDLGDDRIAVEPEIGHGGREYPGPLVVGLVQQFARRAGNHRVRASLAKVCGCHHRIERLLDGALGIGQERSDTSQRFVGFGIENMQDRAD
jgi:hypothetical protein